MCAHLQTKLHKLWQNLLPTFHWVIPQASQLLSYLDQQPVGGQSSSFDLPCAVLITSDQKSPLSFSGLTLSQVGFFSNRDQDRNSGACDFLRKGPAEKISRGNRKGPRPWLSKGILVSVIVPLQPNRKPWRVSCTTSLFKPRVPGFCTSVLVGHLPPAARVRCV